MANNCIPSSSLQSSLRLLYQPQINIPKLIEDGRIQENSWEKCYKKPKLRILRDYDKRSDTYSHPIVEVKLEIDIENVFNPVDSRRPVPGKVLMLGGPGEGKTTMFHNICHKWSKNELWSDKFDWVFRVRLNIMLSATWDLDYTREEKTDLLSCLIHHCLMIQLDENESECIINISDVQDVIGRDKVLLLLDGYNEIESLARGDSSRLKYRKIMKNIFQHKYVIISSRPNAVDCDKYKFERIVELKGLEFAGISQYIDSYFGKGEISEQLKSFIERNTRVRGMCQTPINTVLMCLIWEDFKQNVPNNVEDFNMGLLLREVIIWLGRRYLATCDDRYKNDSKNIAPTNVLQHKLLKYIRKVAYKSFKGHGNFVSAKIIEDELGDLEIKKVCAFGLLKPISEKTGLLVDYQFRHPIFQEYLVAEYLEKSLSSESFKQTCFLIGEHRNEPKYLLTLKFLTGIVSSKEGEEGKDGVVITKFWEAITCNVDGILELGIETKVTLLMHVLEQSKVKGAVDERIPNLHKVESLIDSTVSQDIVRWGEQIIESGYVSEEINKKINTVLTTDWQDNFELRAALAIITGLLNKAEIVETTYLLGRVMTLIVADSNRQLQLLGLQTLYQLLDLKIISRMSIDNLTKIVQLMSVAGLTKSAKLVFTKIFDLVPHYTKCTEILNSFKLKELIESPKADCKKIAINILQDVVKTVPINQTLDAAEISFRFLNSVFEDQEVSADCQTATINILEVVRIYPEQATSEANQFYSRLLRALESTQFSFQQKFKVLDSILYLVKVMMPILSDKPKEVFDKLITMVEENKIGNFEFVWKISSVLKAIPIEEMENAATRAFSLFLAMLNHFLQNRNRNFRATVALNMGTLAECTPEDVAVDSKKDAVKVLVAALDIRDPSFSFNAVDSVIKLIVPNPSSFEIIYKIIDLLLDAKVETNHLLYPSLVCIRKLQRFVPRPQDQLYEDKIIKYMIDLTKGTIRDYYKQLAIQDIEKFLQDMPQNRRLEVVEDGELSLLKTLFEIINNSSTAGAKQPAIRSIFILLQSLPSGRANDVADKAIESLFRVIREPNTCSAKMEALEILPELSIAFINQPSNIVDEVKKLLLTVVDEPFANITDLKSITRKIQGGRILNCLDSALCGISKLLKSLTISEASRIAELVIDTAVEKKCMDGIENIIKSAPLSKSVKFLSNVDIKGDVVTGIHGKLTDVNELAEIDHTQVINLLNILSLSKGQGNHEKLLYMAAQNKLAQIITDIEDNGINWLNVNVEFDKLPNLNETRTFLKELCHKVLKDLNDETQINPSSCEFIVKCIKYGFTTTIKRTKEQKYQLVFEDTSYTINSNNESDLHRITEAALLQDNILANQYKNSSPLFKNTESGQRIAASDVDVRSIINNDCEINWQVWQLSIMHLSDQNRREPSKVYVILEGRDHFGYHVIHKIYVDSTGGTAILCDQAYVLHPNDVSPNFREELFGEMTYSVREPTKPRYYCSTFELTIQIGLALVQQVKRYQPIEEKRDQFILYPFLLEHANLDLNFQWPEYVITARELKKETLFGLKGSNRDIVRQASECVDNAISISMISQKLSTLHKCISDSPKIADSDKGRLQKQIYDLSLEVQKIDSTQKGYESSITTCMEKVEILESTVELLEGQLV